MKMINNTTNMTYNGRFRKIAITDPDMGTKIHTP